MLSPGTKVGALLGIIKVPVKSSTGFSSGLKFITGKVERKHEFVKTDDAIDDTFSNFKFSSSGFFSPKTHFDWSGIPKFMTTLSILLSISLFAKTKDFCSSLSPPPTTSLCLSVPFVPV